MQAYDDLKLFILLKYLWHENREYNVICLWLTPLKWVFNIIDLHLWSWHTKYALLLQPWKKYNPEFTDAELR